MDTTPVVELEDLKVRLGRREILHGITCRLGVSGTGKAVGLLGPNGAGKSTLILTLLGFLRPSAGRARILGMDSRHRSGEARSRIGYMPENDSFIGEMTAVAFLRAPFREVVPEIYVQLDGVVGETLERMGPDTLLVVMSDHGFTSWRRAFHLNSWLRENGYLSVVDPRMRDDPGLFANVDWSRTRAYGLGLNGLYVNVRGRDRFGTVDPQERQALMDEMKAAGFNAIRLPFSLEAIARGDELPNSIDYSLNPDLAGLTVLQVLDRIVDYAETLGMGIILDNHRSAAGSGPNGNGLWYDGGYTEADWIAGWSTLAERYGDHPAIIGADLVNEPHGATWDAWASAAERAGNVCFLDDDGAGLASRLAQRGVLVWGGDGRIRVSAHLYNDGEDIRAFFSALDALT